MAGLPQPAVVSTLKNRSKQIDTVVDDVQKGNVAYTKTIPKEAEGVSRGDAVAQDNPPPPRPPTSEEALAKAEKYAKERADFEKSAKGLPKPGLLDRAKKLVGLD